MLSVCSRRASGAEHQAGDGRCRRLLHGRALAQSDRLTVSHSSPAESRPSVLSRCSRTTPDDAGLTQPEYLPAPPNRPPELQVSDGAGRAITSKVGVVEAATTRHGRDDWPAPAVPGARLASGRPPPMMSWTRPPRRTRPRPACSATGRWSRRCGPSTGCSNRPGSGTGRGCWGRRDPGRRVAGRPPGASRAGPRGPGPGRARPGRDRLATVVRPLKRPALSPQRSPSVRTGLSPPYRLARTV
jgi:hypothetical protein